MSFREVYRIRSEIRVYKNVRVYESYIYLFVICV
jgi:hypothetical protein